MHTEKYSVDKFERRQHEMVDHQNVSTNNWISKAYDNRKIRQRLIKGDNSFDDIRNTQNTKGMNANLNHYVSRRLRMIVFIKQMCYILETNYSKKLKIKARTENKSTRSTKSENTIMIKLQCLKEKLTHFCYSNCPKLDHPFTKRIKSITQNQKSHIFV